MVNQSGNAYSLTMMSPIKNGNIPGTQTSYADETRYRSTRLPLHEKSPIAKVPNTYLARLFILDDVFFEDTPANDKIFNFNDVLSLFSDHFRKDNWPKKDTLQSKYLIFSSNFYGDLDTYLSGMWENWCFSEDGQDYGVKYVWEHCVAFDKVNSVSEFITYVKKCQLDSSLFFNGSTDEPLQEQLKSLYLKQEFTKFAVENQGKSASEIQAAYKAFIDRVQPDNLQEPAWLPGQSCL